MSSAKPGASEQEAEHTYGKAFFVCLALGWAIMIIGVLGMMGQARLTRPANFAVWFIGGVLVHDMVVAPLVFSLGAAIARRVPTPLRGSLQSGLILSALVTLFSFPLVAGFGRKPDDPSFLPNNYAAGLLLVLLAVWTVIGAAMARSWRHASPKRHRPKPPARAR